MCRFASALLIAVGFIVGGARGETVIQLHGQGPFTINLVQKATP